MSDVHRHSRATSPSACQNCGREFYPRLDGPGQFCSRTCSGQSRRKKSLSTCHQCGASFFPRGVNPGKFCSFACRVEAQRSFGKSGHGPAPGDRYGGWAIMAYSHAGLEGTAQRNQHFFHCRCDCGHQQVVGWHTLRDGGSKQCVQCAGKQRQKHGGCRDYRNSPEYVSWLAMRQRCENPHNASYARYGARGIRVCERWQVFKNFLADMGPRPSRKHTIDRKNSDSGYFPENCQWSDPREQANNKSETVRLLWQGEMLTRAELARRAGIRPQVLYTRLRLGWTLEQAMTLPIREGGGK